MLTAARASSRTSVRATLSVAARTSPRLSLPAVPGAPDAAQTSASVAAAGAPAAAERPSLSEAAALADAAAMAAAARADAAAARCAAAVRQRLTQLSETLSVAGRFSMLSALDQCMKSGLQGDGRGGRGGAGGESLLASVRGRGARTLRASALAEARAAAVVGLSSAEAVSGAGIAGAHAGGGDADAGSGAADAGTGNADAGTGAADADAGGGDADAAGAEAAVTGSASASGRPGDSSDVAAQAKCGELCPGQTAAAEVVAVAPPPLPPPDDGGLPETALRVDADVGLG
eukprot:352630-Chlamydomonas_euryale.AAC.10